MCVSWRESTEREAVYKLGLKFTSVGRGGIRVNRTSSKKKTTKEAEVFEVLDVQVQGDNYTTSVLGISGGGFTFSGCHESHKTVASVDHGLFQMYTSQAEMFFWS